MLRLSRCSLSSLSTLFPASSRCHTRIRHKATLADVDSTGIPTKPTWSVNELLSSYPRPSISPATLEKLHELSALIPPALGTPEHAKLTRELEELVKLVEAVKLVDVSEVAQEGSVPDGRVWASGEGVKLDAESFARDAEDTPVDGRSLLTHASRTTDGLYVVESDKPRG